MDAGHTDERAFIYPHTELNLNELNGLLTSLILYDRVHYLEYDPGIGSLSPIRRGGFTRELNLEQNERVQRLISALIKDGALSGILAKEVLTSRQSSAEFPHAFCDLVKANQSILHRMGFRGTGRDGYHLNREKLDTCIAEAIGITPEQQNQYEVEVGWTEGESVLLAYAECVCNDHNITPFALHRDHAATLSAVLKGRLSTLNAGTKTTEERLYAANLFSAIFPVLKEPWRISAETILHIRERTASLREDMRKAISLLFKDHVAKLEKQGRTEYEAMTTVPMHDIKKMTDLVEIYRSELGRNSLSYKKLAVFGVTAILAGAVAVVPVAGMLAAEAFLIPENVTFLTGLKLEQWWHSKQHKLPEVLKAGIVFIDEVEKNLPLSR